MGDLASQIGAWQAAGLIDAETAERLLATIPPDDDADDDDRDDDGDERGSSPAGASTLSSVFGPSVHVSEAFTYLGIGFIAAAWTAFLGSLAVGASDGEAVTLIGSLVSAGAFAAMFLVLRRGDDRWRRGAGVAAFIATGYASVAAWLVAERFLDGTSPLTLALTALATTIVAMLFRRALPSLTTQATFLITGTTLAVTLMQLARDSFFDNGASQTVSSQGEALVQLILETAWWIVTALAFGLIALREAADPDDEPAMRRAGLTRLWAGLVLVIGVSAAVTRTVADPSTFEFRRILEPWIGDLIIIAVSAVLIERAFRRGSGGFLAGGALGMIIALTDLNTSYLTDSVEAGLLIEGVILLSIGFAANRLRQRLDRVPAGTSLDDVAPPDDAASSDDAVPPDAPPLDAAALPPTPPA